MERKEDEYVRCDECGSKFLKSSSKTDIEAGVKAVEYFIRTGEFYPGIDWLHEYE